MAKKKSTTKKAPTKRAPDTVLPVWDGAGRFRDDADPTAVLRETIASCQVEGDRVLEQAIERAADDLGVLELALEHETSVDEAARFIERVRHGLVAALWLARREAVRS